MEVNIKKDAAKLAKRISLLDIDWAEAIVASALEEFFNLLKPGKNLHTDPMPFLCMIYLLLNVSQIDPFTRNIVKKFI